MSIVNGIRVVSVYNPDDGTTVQMNHIVGDDTEWPIRVPRENEQQDPTGGGYFDGYRSEARWRFVDSDGSLSAQLESWFEAGTRVSMVACGASRNVQWYSRDRCQVRRVGIQSRVQGRGDIYECVMIRDGGYGDDHAIYGNVNLLAYLGWEDADSNGVADGYTELTPSTFSFANGEQSIEEDSGLAYIGRNVPFPIAGVPIMLSETRVQLHAAGDDVVLNAAFTFAGSAIADAKTTIDSPGRYSAMLTTPSGTYNILVRVARVENITANGTAIASNPALRVDGSTEYVTY